MDELYKRYSQIVFYFLYKKCNDSMLAEDLMQETFLKAIESIDTYDNSCKMSTWLCQIAKHLLYQHRAKYRHVQLEEFEAPGTEYESHSNTERHAIASIELANVWSRVRKFPPEMKKVVEFRVLGDMSYKEIGEIFGKSESWARVTFFRAKMILIKEFGIE